MTRTKAAFAVVLCSIIVIATIILIPGKDAQSLNAVDVKDNSAIKSAEDRVAYIQKFGWEIDPEPTEVQEVIIPSEFDDVLTKYNDLQQKQGFDLGKYKGKRLKRWTYEVTNYPGDKKTGVRASIYIYNNKVVGGDVSSVELDGFMHELNKFK